MRIRPSAALTVLLPFLVTAGTNDFELARQALRDGLWSVARAHAAKVEGDAAKLLTLESFAREGKWDDILKTLAAWGNPAEEGFRYYRAMGLFKTGNIESARHSLEFAVFRDPGYTGPVARLRARLAMDSGDVVRALEILKAEGGDDPETKMLAAELQNRVGDRKSAEEAWRAVALSTNASESARIVAAANLRDAVLLRRAYSNATTVAVRQVAGLQLGVVLMRDGQTFDEGARLVRLIVSSSPDAPGGREAFAELANRLLERGSFDEAVRLYDELAESWPDTAKDAAVQEGRGWVYLKTGRTNEAIVAFLRAEAVATNDEVRATTMVKVGDILSGQGKEAEAMAKYREVIEKFPQTSAAKTVAAIIRVRELEEAGRRDYAAFRFAEAQKVFARVAAEDPTRKPAMDYFAVLCLYGQGRDDEAEAKARQLTETTTDATIRAEATLWLAKLAYNRGTWKSAQTLFSAYADAQPKSAKAPEALVWAARAAFAENDFTLAVATVARMLSGYPDSPLRAAGLLVQGEALIELSRFDEAVLVLDRAGSVPDVSDELRLRAQFLRADALFAMGADNPVRYQEALDLYRTVRRGADLSPSTKLSLAFKIGRTLEKLRRLDEATDQYYTQVVLAYREGRAGGIRYDDAARAAFSRAAFRLADEFEGRGETYQAVRILELVETSDVPAAAEAARRLERMKKKGNFL